MADSFTIKQGDLRPYLKAQLVRLNDDGEIEGPQDLTGAEAIVFTMKNKATSAVPIDEGTDVTVLGDPTLGNVQYEWQPGDTDIPGSYLGEFEATFGGEPMTFPNNLLGFAIKIVAELS